jgi:hypothetical protein
MVAMSESAFGNQRARYVFACPRSSSEESVTLPPSTLEISGPVFACDWVTHNVEMLPARGSLRMKFTDCWDYQILSPVALLLRAQKSSEILPSNLSMYD